MKDKFFTSSFNAKEVTQFLNKQIEVLGDLSPLMKIARVFMKYTVDENFATEGKHTGEKWESWSKIWKKQRSRMGHGNGRILSLSGELRKSIRAKHGKNYAQVGTNKIYAAIHNFGGDIKRNGRKIGTMPKREFMRINERAKEELLAELYIGAEELLMNQEIIRRINGK